ncbi:GGDEF domain-containing protein, partial [Streptomyces sp. NPDC057676]
ADGPRFLLTHVEDIEERKRHELQLAHRASHDSLTGLPNSAELRARLGARLCGRPPQPAYAGADTALPGPGGAQPAATAVREAALVGSVEQDAFVQGFGFDGLDSPVDLAALGDFAGLDAETLESLTGGGDGGPFDHHVHTYAPAEGEEDDGTKGLAVLFCDLDGFKSINDRFGHHTGDAVLIEVARRLSHGVRDGDTVARLGGDEFVVLADGLGRADAQDLAVRLRNAIIPPIRFEGRAVRVGASFGISWAACGMSAEEVLQSADQRMYVEKRSRSKAGRRAG